MGYHDHRGHVVESPVEEQTTEPQKDCEGGICALQPSSAKEANDEQLCS